MGDRAEVSHQPRTSDDHSLRLGVGRMAATHSARQRASGLDRCSYSGGPAPEMRGRLFVLMADLRWLGRPACCHRRRAIRASSAPAPSRQPLGSPGWKTWDASGPHPHKRPMSDKPDLSLVHLGGVQGSGILCGNRSTSYSRRRIPDRSGRPSVAVHQSNRQGRSRAPSSGQVRDDVSRGDQGAPGR